MLQSFAMKEGHAVGKYLSFLIFNGRPKTADFQFLLDNFKNRLAGWKTNFLTIARRTTLIKFTLNYLPNHTMQYIFLPAHIVQKIERYQRNFLWGNTVNRKKITFNNWNQVTTSTTQGGLNIQKLKLKNYTLLASLAWRIFQNPHSF